MSLLNNETESGFVVEENKTQEVEIGGEKKEVELSECGGYLTFVEPIEITVALNYNVSNVPDWADEMHLEIERVEIEEIK